MSDVKIRILAEDKASAAINQVDKSLDKLATDAGVAGGKAGLGGLSASLGTTLTSVMGLVGGIGILAAGFSKITGFIKSSISSTVQFAQSVRELSGATGIGAEETSRLLQLADDYIIDVDRMAMAMRFAVKNGFDPSIEGLARLSDELKEIADPNDRAARLVEIFGRNWAALVPLLNAGGDAIRENAAAISDNLLFDESEVKSIFAYQQALDNLQDSWEGISFTVGKEVIPVITQFFDAINQEIKLDDVLSRMMQSGLWTRQEIMQIMAGAGEGAAAQMEALAQAEKQAAGQQKEFNQMMIRTGRAVHDVDAHVGQLTSNIELLGQVTEEQQKVSNDWASGWVKAIAGIDNIDLAEQINLIRQLGEAVGATNIPDLIMGLDLQLITEAVNAGAISAEQYVNMLAMAYKGTLQLTDADRKMYEAAIKAAEGENDVESAVIDAAKAMEEASTDAQLLTSSLYGVAQAAFTVANAIIEAKKSFANFGDMKMNLGDTAARMAELLDYSHRGGKEFEIMTQAATNMALAMDEAGVLTGDLNEKFHEATRAAEAFQTANEYFMGDIGARDLRDFAKTSQYAADALYTVYSNAVEVGQIDFAQASQEIARGLGIPLATAQDKLSQFMSGAQQSVTMSVIVQFVATGDLWALSYGGGNWQTGVNTRGNPYFNPVTTGPNPYQFAQGADFVVPGGHPADNFPVWVSSGERVTVTPASKVAGDTYYDIQINSMPSQSPGEIANSVVWKLNEHQRLSRAAGAGYAGR